MLETFLNPAPEAWESLTTRATFSDAEIAARVEAIIADVRTRGDEAIRDLAQRIDGVTLTDLQVSEAEIAQACASVTPAIKEAIGVAMSNIEKFHEAQCRPTVDVTIAKGIRCVQRAVPIQRIGLYIPGGSAPLFSTVLMLAIPARVVGCPDICLCTPCTREGRVADEVLYAATMCGVKRIYKVGGAQAIAAMAYGTTTIPKVDKIFGPGNRYVTKAKQLVSLSQVAIDMPAGPSEVMVMADATADADFVASDLLSQAEHGADSQAMLVCRSEAFAREVEEAIGRQLQALPRRETAERALANSRAVVFDTEEQMIAFANAYRAEHLIISMSEPWRVAERITAAGSIFLGNYSPESAGDYASGTNHTLPTCGWAATYSGVNTDSFVRKITYQELTREGLQNLAQTITTMARAEGLDAHRRAVEIRIEKSL